MKVRGDLIFRKTGNSSWDYFIDPSTLPQDHPFKQTWEHVHSQLYGKIAQERWTGAEFTFVVETPQLMYIKQEFVSIAQALARRNANFNLDVRPATNWESMLEMLYPGENIQYTLKPVHTPLADANVDTVKSFYSVIDEYTSTGVLEK